MRVCPHGEVEKENNLLLADPINPPSDPINSSADPIKENHAILYQLLHHIREFLNIGKEVVVAKYAPTTQHKTICQWMQTLL